MSAGRHEATGSIILLTYSYNTSIIICKFAICKWVMAGYGVLGSEEMKVMSRRGVTD
ncbi:hypothetical protein ACE6H2_006233 [Prunus campanulata]